MHFAACNFATFELQKVVRSWRVLYIFTSKCTSRHNGVQFLDICASKSAPTPSVFQHFHLQMHFAACNFATFELQKVVRSWRVLYIFTWTCVSRHSGVQFLISPLTTWLRATRFNGGCIFFFLALCYCIFCLLTWLLYFAFQLSILSEVGLLNFLRIWQIVEAHLLEHFETGTAWLQIVIHECMIHLNDRIYDSWYILV